MRDRAMAMWASVLSIVLAACAPRGPEIVEIRGDRDGLTRWLHDRASDCFDTLEMAGPERAYYRHSGESLCSSSLGLAPGDGDFVVGTVLTSSDEHFVRRCTVTAITAAGVRIDCVDRFDLRAWGQNRIEIRRSGGILTYRKAQPGRARGARAALD